MRDFLQALVRRKIALAGAGVLLVICCLAAFARRLPCSPPSKPANSFSRFSLTQLNRPGGDTMYQGSSISNTPLTNPMGGCNVGFLHMRRALAHHHHHHSSPVTCQ